MKLKIIRKSKVSSKLETFVLATGLLKLRIFLTKESNMKIALFWAKLKRYICLMLKYLVGLNGQSLSHVV